MNTFEESSGAARCLRVPFLVAIFCASFNFGLAVINARVGGASTTLVTLVQVVATLMVVACILKKRARASLAYLYAAVGVVASWAIVSAYKGSFDISGLYSAVSVPIFVVFGTLFRHLPVRWMTWFVAIVLVVALLETVFPDAYVALANPLSYYRATRVWVAAQDANDVDGLYVGAMRAGGSALSLLDHHRAGSIFLEPLSLGYFAALAFIFFSVKYRDQYRRLGSAFAACVLMSLLADTRVSTLIIVLTLLLTLIRRPPAVATWLMIILVYFGGYLGYQAIGGWGGDLAYRLSLSYESIASASLGQLFFGEMRILTLGDSGLVSMLSSYGLIGFMLFIAIAINLFDRSWLRSSHAPIAIASYFCAASLFGAAMLSIKTSIFLGMVVGGLRVSPQGVHGHEQ